MGSVGKLWVSFERTHQRTPWVPLWKNPVVSFTNLIKMCPPCAWATHWEFFQKVPRNLPKTNSTIYSIGSLRVHGKIEPHWEFFLKMFEWTCWVCFGQIAGYILKELSRSGSGTWQAHFDQICERNHWVISKRNSWVLWWVLSKLTHNLPTDPIKIKAVSKF